MLPSQQAIEECERLTMQHVASGECNCTLCGDQATVAMCWIPSEAMLNKLLTPFGQSRVFGYGVCDQCEKQIRLTPDDSIYSLISQRLIDSLWDCDAVLTPRDRIPAVFLN